MFYTGEHLRLTSVAHNAMKYVYKWKLICVIITLHLQHA
jgi:hypothetical protein